MPEKRPSEAAFKAARKEIEKRSHGQAFVTVIDFQEIVKVGTPEEDLEHIEYTVFYDLKHRCALQHSYFPAHLGDNQWRKAVSRALELTEEMITYHFEKDVVFLVFEVTDCNGEIEVV
jgi:hypothetical protein